MRRQLQDWLDLSLHRGLPSSLLLLSRAFTITANVRDVAQKKWVRDVARVGLRKGEQRRVQGAVVGDARDSGGRGRGKERGRRGT